VGGDRRARSATRSKVAHLSRYDRPHAAWASWRSQKRRNVTQRLNVASARRSRRRAEADESHYVSCRFRGNATLIFSVIEMCLGRRTSSSATARLSVCVGRLGYVFARRINREVRVRVFFCTRGSRRRDDVDSGHVATETRIRHGLAVITARFYVRRLSKSTVRLRGINYIRHNFIFYLCACCLASARNDCWDHRYTNPSKAGTVLAHYFAYLT
jgi:hypothetical protein